MKLKPVETSMRIILIILTLIVTTWPAQTELFDVYAEKRTTYERTIGHIITRIETARKISYGKRALKVEFERLMHAGGGYIAIYDPEKFRLELNVSLARCDPMPIMEPTGTYDRTKDYKYGGECEPAELEKLLAHETGHFYVHMVVVRFAPHGWLKDLRKKYFVKPTPEHLAIRMVSEGIAEYFSSILDPRTRLSKDWYARSMPDWEAMKTFATYRDGGGFALVKPILDANIERGVRCIVQNPLVFPMVRAEIDFSPALEYRTRMIACASE